MNLAPIVLFVYNRPWHTQQTVEALQKNVLAKDSELFIFSDGPKNVLQIDRVNEVRRYIETITGFAKVNIIKQEKNLGLANSVIAGVTEIVNKYGKVIVLEDDLVTSPYFLQFMNDALIFYKNDESIGSIQGFIYASPYRQKLPETFFLKTADCWGWATWKRSWKLFKPDCVELIKELQKRCDLKRFNFDGTYRLMDMLDAQASGKIDSWAIRWVTSLFLENKLSLYPGQALVNNIGLDSSGTHCGTTSIHAVELCMRPILLGKINLKENKLAYKILKRFFRLEKGESFFSPVIFKIKAVLKKVISEAAWNKLKFIKKCYIIFRNKKYIQLLKKRAIVLAYHRVADLETDPQLLAVSPENFEQQLAIISRNYIPISLHDLVLGLNNKSVRHKAVVITFDDGYVDNLVYAKALLEKYKIPATVFVTTGFIGENNEQWWNELERILLLPKQLPQKISLEIDKQLYSWDLSIGDGGSLLTQCKWNVLSDWLPGSRFKMYKDLHILLRSLHHEQREKILNTLGCLVGIDKNSREKYRILRVEEVKELAAGGLIEIGGHTIRHPVLSQCSLEEQREEIIQCKENLEKILGCRVNSFSYPYGRKEDIGLSSIQRVNEAGYTCAVANYHGHVTKEINKYLIPRFLVRNWDGVVFEKKLKEWFGA